MKVLLSIKPEFVREIFQGRKKFEYRKNVFTKHVTQVVVYSTKPEGMIVGEFSVKKILSDTPEKLWKKTSLVSGISKEFFDQYFEGRDKGYALQIENPVLYKEPINPFDVFTSFVAPQSFKYIEEDDIEESVLSFVEL
jgi:predicted transcriptional regulator